jgi:hypothetical protein
LARRVVSKEALQRAQAKSAALKKQYRADAARLKELGVLSKQVNARKNITRGTRTKINKYRDVLEGVYLPVRASPEVRKKYEGIVPARGPFLMVPKEHKKERGKISRGLLEVNRTFMTPDGVPYGEEREVIMPFKLTDMPQVAEKLMEDETLDGLKRGDEMFAFRLDGYASNRNFVDAKEMGDYINQNYQHLFSGKKSQKSVKHLSFVRFRGNEFERLSEHSHTGKLSKKPGHRKREHKDHKARRLALIADKQARKRAKETPEQRQKRLDYQRRQSAINRQRKFEEK